MSEQELLMVGSLSPTVVGSDVLPRRYTLMLWDRHTSRCLACVCLRPQSDRGKKQLQGLFAQTRDHSQIWS
jgi:hypothetical protein